MVQNNLGKLQRYMGMDIWESWHVRIGRLHTLWTHLALFLAPKFDPNPLVDIVCKLSDGDGFERLDHRRLGGQCMNVFSAEMWVHWVPKEKSFRNGWFSAACRQQELAQ